MREGARGVEDVDVERPIEGSAGRPAEGGRAGAHLQSTLPFSRPTAGNFPVVVVGGGGGGGRATWAQTLATFDGMGPSSGEN